jgi:putative membrane protein
VTGPDEPGWHRLHPLSPVVRAGRALVPLVLIVPAVVENGTRGGGNHVGELVVAGIVVGLGVVSWLVTRWRVEDGALRIETGLLRRSSQRYPLTRLQAVDTVRPVVARALGLTELRLRMGGNSGGHGRLAYLPARDADELRARLLALAHGLAADIPPPPERVLVAVPTGRLAGAVLLRGVGLITVAVVVATAVLIATVPGTLAVVASGFFAFVGLFAVNWRRFNGAYHLTVAAAPDGLRLRAGLLETAAETIPAGRVQAVRLTRPLLWRPFGWCRVEVDVAGRARRERENGAVARPLRAVLPVGTRAEADRLLARILPDGAAALGAATPPPPRVRWKAPLRFHYLSWGRTDTCVVTTTGRVTEVTAWVPLAKVQSLRRVQGPLARRLRLATVHLDTAGATVRAALRDRDVAEADAALAVLTDLCRTARSGREPDSVARA